MKTGKTFTISKHASYGNAAIISGNMVYYTELNDSKWTFKLIKYNLKTKKKTVLSQELLKYPEWLDKNHCCYMDGDCIDTYVYDVRTGEATK